MEAAEEIEFQGPFSSMPHHGQRKSGRLGGLLRKLRPLVKKRQISVSQDVSHLSMSFGI